MKGIMVVVGTRPEVIKMAPVMRVLRGEGRSFTFVHSGQHYDYVLSQRFIEELNLPRPDYCLKFRERSPASQTGRMMINLERIVRREKPELMLIQGDTNTMLAAALTAFKQNVPVGHVEAGLRSYDWRMPEEHNRRMVDHASTYLFAPTERARETLTRENVLGKIYVTGNTVIDAVAQHMPIAEERSNVADQVKHERYMLATIHRAENVDNPEVLKNFVEAFVNAPLPIVLPIHPRTRKRLSQYKLWRRLAASKSVQVMPPLGYFDFLILMRDCELILTDSGGLQEEATAPTIRKFVLVLRRSTERPEAVEAGFARVVELNKERILTAMNEALNKPAELPRESPFGDGRAGERIARIVLEELRRKRES